MNLAKNQTLPDYATLTQLIDSAFNGSHVLVKCIKDEAGMRLFLAIDQTVTACLKELNIPLRAGYLEIDSPELIMDRVSMRVRFFLNATSDLREYEPLRAQKLLADLAAKASDVRDRLYLLYDWEWSGDLIWGN